jgi:hypothetical protein
MRASSISTFVEIGITQSRHEHVIEVVRKIHRNSLRNIPLPSSRCIVRLNTRCLRHHYAGELDPGIAAATRTHASSCPFNPRHSGASPHIGGFATRRDFRGNFHCRLTLPGYHQKFGGEPAPPMEPQQCPPSTFPRAYPYTLIQVYFIQFFVELGVTCGQRTFSFKNISAAVVFRGDGPWPL